MVAVSRLQSVVVRGLYDDRTSVYVVHCILNMFNNYKTTQYQQISRIGVRLSNNDRTDRVDYRPTYCVQFSGGCVKIVSVVQRSFGKNS